MKKVSAVITTCKRSPDILLRAIQSVIEQTYPELEILVVDDSPSDYSERETVRKEVEKLADEWTCNGEEKRKVSRIIQYIPHEDCKGACAARNTGIANSTGEIIGFLDDDDEWLPEKIEKMIGAFDDPDTALVYCHNIRVYDETGKEEIIKRPFYGAHPYHELLKSNFIGSTSFPLLRKSALEEIGAFDVDMPSVQDADVWARLIVPYKALLVDTVGVKYHVHNGEQISSNPKKKIAGLEMFYLKNKEYIDAHKDVFWIRHMKLIPFYLADEDDHKAFEVWKKAVKRCPEKVRRNLGYLKKIIVYKQGKKTA